MNALLQGFLVSGGLIVAIGAQNAFVLKQGLKRWRVLPIVLTCFLGVMDKFHAKKRCSPYAARLYARSKPLNTKNAFSAAPNRLRKTGIVTTGNSNTIAAPVSANS